MARKKYGRSRSSSIEEVVDAKIWKFIGNLARNHQIDPEDSTIWQKFLKENDDIEKSEEELTERFSTVLLPKISIAELDIRTKIRLYLALPIPLDPIFKAELRKNGKDIKTDRNKWLSACGYLKRPKSSEEFPQRLEKVRRIDPRQFQPEPPVHSSIRGLQTLWSEISASSEPALLSEYKSTLKRLLNGRISCLTHLTDILPEFPEKLLVTHEKFYSSLCQISEAYAFKNHEGLTLTSRYKLPDRCQIGAQILFECITRDLLPLDLVEESWVCERIEFIVRIGIKDMLEEAVKRSQMSFPESLTDRLLKNAE